MRVFIRHIREYSQLHFPSSVLKPNMNSSLALINTVCLLFFNRKVLRSHLNKPVRSIWSRLKSSHRCLFEIKRERKSQQSSEQVRRRRFQIGDATSHMLQGDEVQISALKEYVPCGHVWDLCVFSSFFFPPQSSKFKRGPTKGGLKYSQPPKEYSRRLSLQVKNVYANAGYIRACTGC